MTLFIALSVLIAIAAAQVTPYCPTQGVTPTNVVNDCNSKCQFNCGPSSCELTHTGGGASSVSCGGASSTIAPFCPPTLDSPGPSSNTPCGNGCQYTCTGSAGSSLCTLTLDQASSMWSVKCGGSPSPPGAMTRTPFCPTTLNSPGPSSSTPCGDGCMYTCTGSTGYAQCTLLYSASSSQWNVQCGNTVPFGSPQTNPPPGQTTPFTQAPFTQPPQTQPTAAPGQIECPANTQCANMLPGCNYRYCGCENGQLKMYFCRDPTTTGQFQQTTQPVGPQPSGPFVQPTQPQFTTAAPIGSMQCNVATICDPFVAQAGKQCTVATGAQCLCNLQGAVYSKTCPSSNLTPGGSTGGCSSESMSLCQQQCVGSQAMCDCNADGSVRGVKCGQSSDDKAVASSLGACLALAGATLVALQFN